MSKKNRSKSTGSAPARKVAAQQSAMSGVPTDRRAQIGLIVVALVLISVVVIGADWAIGTVFGSPSTASPAATGQSATSAPAATQFGVVVQGVGGHWTNVGADQLASMLTHKDFTLVNVKTPYMGEIDGTDLWIPYDQVKAQASKLPGDNGTRILVYCRSGVESAQAAQSLLDLGYTNVWNLDGGMTAWQASGRQLVTKNR
jgi:rhodanese-related sulfurtransferase